MSKWKNVKNGTKKKTLIFCVSLTVLHPCMILQIKPTRCTIPSLYVYFYSLHVSGKYVPIIRRIDCICTTLGVCQSVLMTVWYAGWDGSPSHPAYQTVINTQ
jgi:hypothetical protein